MTDELRDKAWASAERALTRGEELLKNHDPRGALNMAEQAMNSFKVVGFPDWWSRAERLWMDARLMMGRDATQL